MKQLFTRFPWLSQRGWRNVVIWSVPVGAFILAMALLVQTRLSEGPVITITFRTAAGLEPGKTAVKYKEVTVGVVDNIAIDPDTSQVLVRIQLAKNMQNLVRADTRFWVVRPRIGVSDVSGIDTLLSGAYIGVDKGRSPENKYAFTGLEIPPAIINDTAGSPFMIETDDLGSLDINSPVYYRRVQVGRVTSYRLRNDGKVIDLQIFVESPYDKLVQPDSRFWNVSGVDLSVGSEGFHLKTQTVAAIMVGGIAFSSPDETSRGILTRQAHYTLAPDQATALSAPEGPATRFQLRFEHALHGLYVGAPVEFSSIKVGRVVSITPDYNPQAHRFPVKVDIDVYPSLMGEVLDKLPKSTTDTDLNTAIFTREMVKHGLRAQAVFSNLLTGQLYISVDFVADAPGVEFDITRRPLVLPTIEGGLSTLQDQLTDIVKKINKMPLEAMGKNMNGVFSELSLTLRKVNNQTLPAADLLMKQMQLTTRSTQDLIAADSPLLINLIQSLQQASRTFKAVRSVADQLDRHPESLLWGRATESRVTDGTDNEMLTGKGGK